MQARTITHASSRIDKLSNRKVKGFDPYVQVSVILEGTGAVLASLRTATVDGGGPNCEFVEQNRLEFSLQDLESATPSVQSKPNQPNPKKLVLVEVWDADLGADFLIGRAILSWNKYWEQIGRKDVMDSVDIKEVLTDEEAALGSKPGLRGKLNASIYRPSAESQTLVLECWSCEGLIKDEGTISETRLLFYMSLAVLIVYFGVGIAVFSSASGMNDEISNGSFAGKKVLNAAYFVVVIATTVGYGDVLPVSDGMKIFTAFYAAVGVGIIGAALGIVMSYLIELQDSLTLKAVSADKSSEDDEPSAWKSLAKSWGVVLLFVVGGTFWFKYFENFGWSESFYTTMISLLTVGYGDFSFNSGEPDKEGGRVFGIFFLLLGTVALARGIGATIQAFTSSKMDALADWRLSMALTPELLEKMDEDGNGEVSEQEFVKFMMQHVTKVTASDIELVRRRFREADVDGSGTLTKDDLLPPRGPLPVPSRESTASKLKSKLPRSARKEGLSQTQEIEMQVTASNTLAIPNA